MRDRPTIHRARIAAAVVGLLLVTAVPASATVSSPLADVVPSPPREQSPFSVADAFCTPDGAPPPAGRLASAPGVTARTVTVAFVTPPPTAGAATAGDPSTDPGTVARVFGRLANRCGGVSGRRIDVEVVPETGDPATDCARVAEAHAFVVVAATPFNAAPCVAKDMRTVTVATGDRAANSVLASTQGRLAVAGGTDGELSARILDLIESGRLDHRRVSVVATHPEDADAQTAHALLAAADPRHGITVGPVATTPSPPYDAVVMTSFDPSAAAAATGTHGVPVYLLGDTAEASLGRVRTTAGRVVAHPGGTGVYSWIAPDLATHRSGGTPTKFATICNHAFAQAVAPTGPSSSSSTTTTLPPTTPDGPFARIAGTCLAWRVTLRALAQAGPEPTQRSLVRALYRLPYVDNAVGGPDARPNQVVNEPLTRAGVPVFLAEAESPCKHAAPATTAADAAPCWVPVPGWESGHPVNAPLGPEPRTGAAPRS